MSITVTLNNISNLQDTTTAQTQLNTNNATVTAGFTSALNTTGDKMLGNLDMNSNQILNLPAPGSANSPVRLQDVVSSSSVVSISSVPPTGTSGAVVGFLNGNNTWSGTETHNGAVTFNSSVTSTGILASNGGFYVGGGNGLGVNFVTAASFGAGPSNPDNASSLQAAINYVYNNWGGGFVYLPLGSMVVGSTVTVKGGVVLVGYSRQYTTISVSTDINPVFFNNTSLYGGLRDLEVIGYQSSGGTSQTPAVSITSNAPVVIQNCNLWYGSAGLSTQGVDGCVFNSYIFGHTACIQSVGGANWYVRCKLDSVTSTTYAVHHMATAGGAGAENSFVSCDLSGPTTSLYVNDSGSASSLTRLTNCVLSGTIQIANAKWTALSDCEFGMTSISLSSSGGVISIANCYAFAAVTTAITGGASKIITGNFQIT